MKSLSILIVEDNSEKLGKVEAAIKSAGIVFSCDVAETIISAKQFVVAKQYDLLILDLSLPNYPGEAEREDAGANFLREVQDYDIYHPPKYVIGVTAFEELSDKYGDKFSERFWRVITVESGSDSWSREITSFVQHLGRVISKDDAQAVVDVVVITALSDEFDKILSLPFGWSSPMELDDQIYYRLGTVVSGGQSISVAAICSLRMGPVPAATLGCKAMAHLRPRVIGMTGICAGVKGQANLGDIVAATEVFSWESGKLIADSDNPFLPEPVSVSIAEIVVAKVQQIQSDSNWLDQVRREYGGQAPVNALQIVSGPIATGGPVVSDTEIVERIRKINRKTVGIEMEAFGLLFAARSWRASPPLLFCFKAVSDFANSDKDDSVRHYASYVSARLFGEMLIRFGGVLLPPR